MKRQWRAGRIILAVLLVSLAGLAFYVWPLGPRWRIPAEQVLGFDLERGLLITYNSRTTIDMYELHGFDLVTGERKVCKKASLKGMNRNVWNSSHAVLSADGSTMACSDSSYPILVYDVRQECQQIFSAYPHALIDSIGLSSNGELLAYICSNDLKVWDCKTSTIKYRLSLSNRVSFALGNMIVYGFCPELIQFSADGRYLAAGGEGDAIFVFDLCTGRAIGLCPNAQIPIFLPDNRTLIAMPRVLGSGKVQWYQLEGETIKSMPLSRQLEPEREELLTAGPSRLLTFGWENGPRGELPKWIPALIREKLETALGWTSKQWFIKSTHTSTGQVREEFSPRIYGFRSARVSSDGLLLALEEDSELSLWDIPPRRSTTCWLVCCSIAIFALWLAWPRKVKLA